MKRFAAIVILSLVSLGMLRATVLFDSREYKPKGKHYTAKYNYVYHRYITSSSEKIILLFYKTDKGLILYKGLEVSKNLENKLPAPVIKYIGLNIADVKMKETHSIDDVLSVVRNAITKALDRTWLDNLKNNAEEFAKRPLYDRNFAGYDMNYYEFVPLEKDNLSNPSELHDTTVLKVFSDSTLKAQAVILEKNKILNQVKDNLLKKPDFDRNDPNQKNRYNNLIDVINQLGTLTYHHDNLKVSDWPLASPKKWKLHTSSPAGFHVDTDSTCKYLMILQATLKKEQFMPAMAWKQNYGNWKATRCNMFAGDFSQQTLGLRTYPWGTKDWNAHSIHTNLPGIKAFISIPWDKVWEYGNMGYPVFITTPKPPGGDAGHIAVAYPIKNEEETTINDLSSALTKGRIVQAGSSNGLKMLNEGFDVSDLEDSGTAYIYLGYLK
jgi:hypothetical protein